MGNKNQLHFKQNKYILSLCGFAALRENSFFLFLCAPAPLRETKKRGYSRYIKNNPVMFYCVLLSVDRFPFIDLD